MKHICPHCNNRTISSWDKFNSSGLHPAECPVCKGVSMQNHAGGEWISLIGMFGLPITVIISVVVKSWLPISLFATIMMTYSTYRFINVPMIAANIESAKKQHWFAFVGLIIILIWLVYEAI